MTTLGGMSSEIETTPANVDNSDVTGADESAATVSATVGESAVITACICEHAIARKMKAATVTAPATSTHSVD